jgi:hypothetical protein
VMTRMMDSGGDGDDWVFFLLQKEIVQCVSGFGLAKNVF